MSHAGPDRDKPLINTKVLVIGAGMAGLAVGHAAHLSGADVTVLEARDRLGGRIWTDHSLGVPVDLGVSWIHKPKGNPVTQLARAVGAQLHKTGWADVIGYHTDGTPIDRSVFWSAIARVDHVNETIDEEADKHQTMLEALQKFGPDTLTDPLMRAIQSVWTEFDAGATLAGMSALPYEGTKEFKGTDVLLPGGYDALFDVLTPGLDIRLNHAVDGVELRETGVVVRVGGEVFEANCCICTLPIGVLQSGVVEFAPALPGKLKKAISRIGSGAINKVVLRFDRVFWDDVPGIYHASESGRWPLYLNANKMQPGTPVLVNYMTGDHALSGEHESDADLAEQMMEPLRRIYGSDIPDPVEVLVSRWFDDPFALGSYSYATPQTRKKHFRQFEMVLGGRLAFAGEHTHPKYRSTAHGAYLSGLRAAAGLSP